MSRRLARAIALAIAFLSVPSHSLAQSAPAAPAAAAAPAVEPTPPVAPVPPAAPAPAPAKPGVTIDMSGWFQTHYFHNFGALNASDLPQFAVKTQRDLGGISARQSRLRWNVGLPSDGLLGGAKLKGLAELDFMGPLAGDDQSLPAVRLRHAWVSASWKEHANFTLLVGQSWGIFTGPYFATSLAHLAVPRFGGAGFLFRRAPQVRISAESSGDLAVAFAAAALGPYDKNRSPGATSPFVGERSGMPDGEARVAVLYRQGGKSVLDVGLSGHYGKEAWNLDAAAVNRDKIVDSWGASVDARVDLPALVLQGAAWTGKALAVYNTVAPEVKTTAAAAPGGFVNVSPVKNSGAWIQAVVTPTPIVQLLAGYGIEKPEKSGLPGSATTVNRNEQVSGGAILALTSRWKVSTELTYFKTKTQDAAEHSGTQLELGSLYAF